MAFTTKRVRELTATVTVEYGGDEGQATYARGRITSDWWDSLVEGERVLKLVSDVLVWLDYEDEDGNNLSPQVTDPEARAEAWHELLRREPTDFVRAIFNAIYEDLRPGKSHAGASGGSSQEEA